MDFDAFIQQGETNNPSGTNFDAIVSGTTAPAPKKSLLRKVGDFFTGSTQKFGKTIGESIAAPSNAQKFSDVSQQQSDIANNLQMAIASKQKAGQDTTRLVQALELLKQDTPNLEQFTGDVINKTDNQVIGEGIGTGLEALSGGLLESGAKTALSKTLGTGQKLLQGARIGGTFGAIGGAANSLQNNDSDGNIALNTALGGALGAGVGVAGEGLAAGIGKVASLIKNGDIQGASNIMNRVARLTPKDANEFKNISGMSHGEYLTKTGNFGTPEKIIENESQKFINSLDQVDSAIAKLPGTYKSEPVTTALDELLAREKNVSTAGAESPEFARIQELVKSNNKEGLTMEQVNQVKRLYERLVKLNYAKDFTGQTSEKLARATNIDSAMRHWQFTKAKELGLENLPELNKQTQMSRFIINKLGKQIAGKTGNDAITLTDWIMLSHGDPTAIAGFLVKKGFSSKGVQSKIAKTLAPEASIKATKATLNPTVENTLRQNFPKGVPLQLGEGKGSTIENRVPITLMGESTIEKPATVINRSNTVKNEPKPLLLKAGDKNIRNGATIKLPEKTESTKLNDLLTTRTKLEQQRAQEKLKVSYSASKSLSKAKSTSLSPLEAEARKYKSAEEFVKAKYKGKNPNITYVDANIKKLNNAGFDIKTPDDVVTLYHGSNKTGLEGIKKTGFNEGSYFASDRKAAEGFVGQTGDVIPVKVKVSDLGFVKEEAMAGTNGVIVQNFTRLMPDKNGVYTAKVDDFISKETLTDIYNKAVGGKKPLLKKK